MQEVVTEPREPFGPTTGETQLGRFQFSRISWGAVLSGTVTILAVSLILWALALAIISLAMHPTASSLKGAAIAAWICAMATTLVGAFVGGMVAGGSPRIGGRRLAMAHGFVSWGLALLVSFVFQMFLLGGAVGATATAVEAAMGPEAPISVAPMGTPAPRAPAATRTGAAPTTTVTAATPTPAAGHVALDYLVGASWSWFGTWAVAGLLAMAGAASSVRRREQLVGEREEGTLERRRPIQPLTPATSS